MAPTTRPHRPPMSRLTSKLRRLPPPSLPLRKPSPGRPRTGQSRRKCRRRSTTHRRRSPPRPRSCSQPSSTLRLLPSSRPQVMKLTVRKSRTYPLKKLRRPMLTQSAKKASTRSSSSKKLTRQKRLTSRLRRLEPQTRLPRKVPPSSPARRTSSATRKNCWPPGRRLTTRSARVASRSTSRTRQHLRTP